MSLRVAREALPAELVRFVEGLPARIAGRLAAWGILETRQVQAARSLRDHVGDFREHLRAKGNSERHVEKTARMVEAVLVRGCRFAHWTDVRPEPVERILAAEREAGLSRRASNEKLRACRHFTAWGMRTGRLSEDPLRSLAALNERTDRRRVRRALSPEEQARLLEATRRAPERHGMSGEARAWTYRLGLETGLRASELRSLTVASFEGLEGEAPAVRVLAAYAKNRREDLLPMRIGTARELAGFLRGRMPQAPALPIPHTWRSAEMLSEDLAEAGIEPVDDAGRVVDFHAIRHTFVSTLAAGGVAPKVAQALARHSTITLTLDRYTHLGVFDERSALDALPDLEGPADCALRATGSDSPIHSPVHSPIPCASGSTSLHRSETRTPKERPENAVLWWALEDSNLRPSDYESPALTD